jgi:hypothetical protein
VKTILYRPMVSEIRTKQSVNEENSCLFMNSILLKAKTGRNLKSEKSQVYTKTNQRSCTFMNSASDSTFTKPGTNQSRRRTFRDKPLSEAVH